MSTPARRPRKLEQPDVVWTLLDALGRGETLPAALRAAGVAPSTFYRERRQSPLLRGLIEQAEAAGRLRQALAAPQVAAPPAPVAESSYGPPIELAAEPTIGPPAELAAEPTIGPPAELAAEPTIVPLAVAPAEPTIVPPAELAAEAPPKASIDTEAVGPRPVDRPNVAGLLDRLAPRPASRTVVVTVERPAAAPRPPMTERAAERARTTLSGLAQALTSASRASARERQESVHLVPHAEERPGGSDGLLPQIVLIVQLVVAALLVGNLGLPLAIAAVAIAYFLAFRRQDTAAGRRHHAQPVAVGPAEVPVDATHDLRWLDATLARRPPVTKGK